MESFENVFIAYADILGYENVRERLKICYNRESASAILSDKIRRLDELKDWSNRHEKISWIKYGDAYFIHSHVNNEDLLKQIIKTCC